MDDQDVEFIAESPGNRLIDIPKKDQTRVRELLDFNVIVDGSDVCVGHAMSLVDGDTMNYILSSSLTKNSPLKFLMDFIQTDTPGEPIPVSMTHTRTQIQSEGTPNDRLSGSIFVKNINGHSTRIHIVKTFSKTYIWYHNPWGFEQDFSRITESSEELNTTRGNEPWFHLMGSSPDFYDYGVTIDDDPEDEFLLYGKNVTEFYGKDTISVLYKDELTAWENWTEMTHQHGVYIPEFHIMSVLSLLKNVNHKHHIEIIHPYHSMLRHGPQTLFACQGIGKLNRFIRTNVDVGSCVVWDELYTIHANHLLGKSILNNTVDNDLPVIVTQKLLVDPLLGEKDERRLIGKLVFLLSPDRQLKTMLSLMFSLIPKEDDVVDKKEYYSKLGSGFDWIKSSVVPGTEIADEYIRRFILLAVDQSGVENKYFNEVEEIMIRMSFIKIPDDTPTYLLDMIMILISCKHSEYFKEFKNELVFPGSFTF